MKSLIFTLLFFTLSASVFASQNKKTLKVRIQSPTFNTCDATLYFDDGIVPAYDVHQDALMVHSGIAGIPEIYSYTSDKMECSINGCGTLQTTETVSLGYRMCLPGKYTLSASLLSNFDPTSVVKLIDNKLGITTDLRENFYQVQLDSTDDAASRFTIIISSAVQYTSVNANCANTEGSITITPDSSITWDVCQLLDSNNQVLQTYNDVTGTITFSGLSAGGYQVVYTYQQYSASNTFMLHGNYVTAKIGLPDYQVYTNQDAMFDAIAANADHFNWDFGDSTLIVGVAHPTQVYLVPGTYTLSLTARNDQGCSAMAQQTVVVLQGYALGINEQNKKEASIITQGKVVNVNMNDATLSNARVLVYNLLGQSVKNIALNTQTASIDLQNEATGYYLVSIRNAGNVNTKRVFIGQ